MDSGFFISVCFRFRGKYGYGKKPGAPRLAVFETWAKQCNTRYVLLTRLRKTNYPAPYFRNLDEIYP